MGKPDEKVKWLQKLGVNGLKSSEKETKEKTEADTLGRLPADDAKRADTGGGRGKILFPQPIGELELLSTSRADNHGRAFDVTIPNSDQVSRLFQAAQSGKSLGTVKISVGGMEVTLQDVQVSSIQISDSIVQMRLDSSKSAEIHRESDR